MNYWDKFRHAQVEEGEMILILDFSLPPEDMVRLVERAGQVYWIDHHDTHLQSAEAHGYADIPGVRIDGSDKDQPAACELAWSFFMDESDGLYAEMPAEWRTPVPRAVELIGRYDMWDHDDTPNVLAFQEGMKSIPNDPGSRIWDEVISFQGGTVTPEGVAGNIANIVREGGAILRAHEDRWMLKAKSCAFETTITRPAGPDSEAESYPVLAINHFSPDGWSRVLGQVDYSKYAFVVLFTWLKEGYWKASFYRDNDSDLHLGNLARDVAKKFDPVNEGGGRSKTAGMSVRRLPFELRGQ